MTIPGTLTSYDLTAGVIVNMDEAIYMYSPDDLPFLTGQSSDGLSVLGSQPLDQTTCQWMDEDILSPQASIAAQLTTGTTFVTLSSNAERLRFSTGDLLMVEKTGVTAIETMRVTGYGATTAGTILVDRAYAGTATDYATSASVIGVGTALGEAATAENARAVDRNVRTNVTQIFGPTRVQLSGTARVVPRYGVPDEWTKQLANRVLEDKIRQEQAIIYGRKRTSTADTQRAMGGMVEYITTNQDTTSTQITETTLVSNLQSCYVRGGVPDRLAANPIRLSNLNALTDTGRVRTDVVDTRRGRARVQTVITEFGDIMIVRNRWIRLSHAIGFRREQAIRRVLRPNQFEMLAKTGDFDSAHFLCEESLEFKGERHAFMMFALTG